MKYRSQLDDHDAISRQDVVTCSEDEDMTRQEFKDDSDINKLVERHGLIVRPVKYGEHNFDEDLTAQMQSRSVFQLWFESAPANVKEMYPDLGSFLAAFASGAFKTGLAGVEVPSSPDSPSATPPEAGAQG